MRKCESRKCGKDFKPRRGEQRFCDVLCQMDEKVARRNDKKRKTGPYGPKSEKTYREQLRQVRADARMAAGNGQGDGQTPV